MIKRSFISYQVRDPHNVKWNFISPESIFFTVDCSWWEEMGYKVEHKEQWESLAQLEKVGHSKQVDQSEPTTHSQQTGQDRNDAESHRNMNEPLAEERRNFFARLDVDPQWLPQETEWGKSLAGRSLLLSEICKIWPGGQSEESILVALQKWYIAGLFDWHAAVGVDPRSSGVLFSGEPKLYCRRCGYGEREPSLWKSWRKRLLHDEQLIRVHCASCGQADCTYCPRCLNLGIAKSCDPLLVWDSTVPAVYTGEMGAQSTKPAPALAEPDPAPDEPALPADKPDLPLHVQAQGSPLPGSGSEMVRFEWEGELSPAQQEASRQVYRFVHGEEHHSTRDFLVWAVCGAGKTEVLFATIYQSLQKAHKILMTSPRRDVILELAPRLRQAFPLTPLAVLHAESEQKFEAADLYVATTHQTLRFNRFFDLVIIDEEDAFPYHQDSMLPYAVQRATKKEGRVIYLTATPTQHMISRVERNQLQHVSITKRYHGRPLAVPEIQVVGKWRRLMEKGELITPLLHYLTHLIDQKRYGYLFVPHVRDLETTHAYISEWILPYLREQWQRQNVQFPEKYIIESVHASSTHRTDIVQRYREQCIDLLLTTTILERGVTIPYSDAAVIGSDDDVFDTAALIQIAGRVGRKWEDPVGHVWFFPEARTNAQHRCIQQIEEWNRSHHSKEGQQGRHTPHSRNEDHS